MDMVTLGRDGGALSRAGFYMMDHKECLSCLTVKPLTEFSPSRRGRLGRDSYCRACRRIYSKSPRRKAMARANSLKHHYGLTMQQYELIFDQQMGLCKICGQPPAYGKYLAVDHDHSCCPGRQTCGACIRGLVCNGCNVKLSAVDDIEWLQLANSYLSEWRLTMALPSLSGRGFLLSDGVDLKYSKSGVAYAHLPLSFRNSKKTEQGWTHDKEIRVDATVFGRLAEALTDVVNGRVELAVSGEPYFDTWTDKEGNERLSVKMIASAAWPVKEDRDGAVPARAGAKASDEPWPF